MAKKGGHITLRGRFSPGAEVRLVKVAGPHVLRPTPADEVVGEATVEAGKDGIAEVTFEKGVEVGARYFIVGQWDGQHLEVRVTGRAEDDPADLLTHAPVLPDPVRLGLGGVGGPAPLRGQRASNVRQAPHDAAKKDAIAETKSKDEGKSTTAKRKG